MKTINYLPYGTPVPEIRMTGMVRSEIDGVHVMICVKVVSVNEGEISAEVTGVIDVKNKNTINCGTGHPYVTTLSDIPVWAFSKQPKV